MAWCWDHDCPESMCDEFNHGYYGYPTRARSSTAERSALTRQVAGSNPAEPSRIDLKQTYTKVRSTTASAPDSDSGYGGAAPPEPSKPLHIRERHIAVDIGFMIAGAFFSSTIQTLGSSLSHTQKVWVYGTIALLAGIGSILFDLKNVEDEERIMK